MNPPNIFSQASLLMEFVGNMNIVETRCEYDANDNPIYVGFAMTPSASTSDNIWFIMKMTYSGNNMIYKQLPDDGRKFAYVWDSKETYFT